MNHSVLLTYISLIVYSTFILTLMTVCKCVMLTTGLCRTSCQALRPATQAAGPQVSVSGRQMGHRCLIGVTTVFSLPILNSWAHPLAISQTLNPTNRKLNKANSDRTWRDSAGHKRRHRFCTLHEPCSVEGSPKWAAAALWIKKLFLRI